MKAFVVLLNMILLMTLSIFGQSELQTPIIEGIPEFFYDIVNVASNEPGLSRLNVYIEIPYDELQFLKYDEYFKANYEISTVIFDNQGDQIDGKIWQEEVIVDNYDLTNSRKHYSFTHNNFHLKPNEYRISIGLMDMDSRKTGNRKSVFTLRDFQKEKLSVSDVTFTDNVGIDSIGVKSIHPQVADCIKSIGSELYCYFEIYSHEAKNKAYGISYQIKNSVNKTIENQAYTREKDGPRTLEYFKIDKNILSHGKYLLELEVKYGKLKDIVKKIFIIRWAGVPSTVSDLSNAIDQLRYIAKSGEIEEIKNAPQAEQMDKFEKFWEKRDPTPGTAKNELMDEYYNRIEYCNENFSGLREGWKTDMGMIYIIFGPPSDIERHPFERGYKPFEIWYYYHINRQFIFVDETGFGDYRLRNPNWRSWQDGIYY